MIDTPPPYSENALTVLTRIAQALERLAPPPQPAPDFKAASAFVFLPEPARLSSVTNIKALDLTLLHGIGRVKDQLYDNTLRFAKGFAANNVLLWGARGMGKSSLIKAVHQAINTTLESSPLKLIEIFREDIASLPQLLSLVRGSPARCIIFCDDLSFDHDDTSYKALKAVLEGGLEGRPENVVFYATSNRRHLLPRDMRDNESATAINPGEAIEEKTSLSDRFGLWLGFYPANQQDYLAMVAAYARHFALDIAQDQLIAEALEWAITRGNRSGRTAWQFITDVAGRQGKMV